MQVDSIPIELSGKPCCLYRPTLNAFDVPKLPRDGIQSLGDTSINVSKLSIDKTVKKIQRLCKRHKERKIETNLFLLGEIKK